MARGATQRVAQPAVLAALDSLYAPQLGRARWQEARAALLAGRHGWQYAAARNRFFPAGLVGAAAVHGQPPCAALHRRLGWPEGKGVYGGAVTPTEADLRVLLGLQHCNSSSGDTAADVTSLRDICADWPTAIECYISEGSRGRVFPRCGVPGRLNPYWLLSAASVLPVLTLDPQPNDRVLDMCASPGGKSFLLLQHTDGVQLHSNDSKRSRMLAQALRCHVPHDVGAAVTITSADGRQQLAAGAWGGQAFDRVLVDAPCTTDKHLAISTSATAARELRRLRSCYYPRLQQELLLSGLRALRRGGSLVYCTCTMDRRQNSEVVQQAIRELHRTTAAAGGGVAEGGGAGATYYVEPLYDKLREFGEFFELHHDDDGIGVLVVPTLQKNWGPLFVALVHKL
jgi:hypothetical protein|eukprot:COSAG01_NODE_5177_length_4431_cov_265.386657_5_plen_399_part_00